MEDNSKALSQYYDQIAANYDHFANSAQYAVPEWITNHIKFLPEKDLVVIDLACGNGYLGKLLDSLKIKPQKMSGYDLSPNMIEEVKRTQVYTESFMCNLSEGLPSNVVSSSVDLIMAYGLFEFVKDEEKLLRDLTLVLKRKGEIWCSFEVPSTDEALETVDIIYGQLPLKKYRKSETYIRRLFEGVNLAIIEFEKKRAYVSPTSKTEVSYYFVRAYKP